MERAELFRGAWRDWRQAPLTELTAYIIDTHHYFTRQELDRNEHRCFGH